MSLTERIQQCVECLNQKLASPDRLGATDKPFVKFEVENKWRPSKVSILFIAESPP